MVIDAAFEVTRAEGIEAVKAKNVAGYLKCSTQMSGGWSGLMQNGEGPEKFFDILDLKTEESAELPILLEGTLRFYEDKDG